MSELAEQERAPEDPLLKWRGAGDYRMARR